jgi:hypothetical protein
MFNKFIKDMRSYYKIFRCRLSGKHKVEKIPFGGKWLVGCRTCNLWRNPF